MLSFPHSLASNKLTGNETGYVKKSKVQGSSFEVGAKVTYEGREMVVSKVPDSDGELKMIDLSGVMALAACLPECDRLTSLECACAAAEECLLSCHRPMTPCSLTIPAPLFAHSLEGNSIKAEGASTLAATLKETKITNLRCGAAQNLTSTCPHMDPCQCPLTPACSHCPHSSLAVSSSMTSESRAPPRSLPSSKRR